jgi:hypothetical protein
LAFFEPYVLNPKHPDLATPEIQQTCLKTVGARQLMPFRFLTGSKGKGRQCGQGLVPPGFHRKKSSAKAIPGL